MHTKPNFNLRLCLLTSRNKTIFFKIFWRVCLCFKLYLLMILALASAGNWLLFYIVFSYILTDKWLPSTSGLHSKRQPVVFEMLKPVSVPFHFILFPFQNL